MRAATLRFVIILVGMIARKMLIQQKRGDWPQEQVCQVRWACTLCDLDGNPLELEEAGLVGPFHFKSTKKKEIKLY